MLKEYIESLNISPTKEMLEKFSDFSKILVSENEKMNLTAITDENEIQIKHYIDSLTILKTGKITDKSSIIDIGCGAGFPSFPIKFVLPDCSVTQLDSLNKRVGFLNLVKNELKLEKIEALHFRAEEGGKNPYLREKFDVACARAVAALPSLIELSIPFVKVGGYFISMKGSEIDEEIKASKNALSKLNCKIEDILSLSLPHFEHKRNIVVIKKEGATDNKYPRQAPKPIKQPL